MSSRAIPVSLVRVPAGAAFLALIVGAGGCEIVFDFEDRPLRECTPRALACDGGERVRCDADGLGLSPEACPAEAPLCVGEGECVGCVVGEACPTANPCEAGHCEAGTCVFEILVGQACAAGVCTATGVCAACDEDADCGEGDDCNTPRCDRGSCRVEISAGEPCEAGVCDEVGACVECRGVSDCEAPATCHAATCEAGLCLEVPAARGTDCGDLDCDGEGACGECEPGERACEAHILHTCSDRGLIAAPTSCAAGCADGDCLSAVSLAQGTPLDHMCAVWSDGSLVCWGSNVEGQLGRPTEDVLAAPPGRVPGLEGVVQTSAGERHTCAVDRAHSLHCFGDNRNGQASGDGTTSTTSPVREVPLPGPVRAVAAGASRTCAILEPDGRVVCWGNNERGQLGVGDDLPRLVPTEVLGLSEVVEMALGAEMTCARTRSGQVHCWGRDDFAGTGAPSTPELEVLAPVAIGIDDAMALRGGDLATCAVRASGQGVCWGGNSEGELGDGTDTQGLSPVPLAGTLAGGGVSIADIGFRHGCAAVSDGVRCWGRNGCGQLGFGNCGDGGCGCSPGNVSPATQRVQGLGPVLDLSVAWGFACAIEGVGVKCWGDNGHGQLGGATDVASAVPVAVLPPED